MRICYVRHLAALLFFTLTQSWCVEPVVKSELKKVTFPISDYTGSTLRWEDNTVYFDLKPHPSWFWDITDTCGRSGNLMPENLSRAEAEEWLKKDWAEAYTLFICPEERKSFHVKPTSCSSFISGTCRRESGFKYPNPVSHPNGNGPSKDGRPFILSAHKPAFSPDFYKARVLSKPDASVVLEINSEGQVKSQEVLISGVPFDRFMEKFDQEEKAKIELRKGFAGFLIFQEWDQNPDEPVMEEKKFVFKNKDPNGVPKALVYEKKILRADEEELNYWDPQTTSPLRNAEQFGLYLFDEKKFPIERLGRYPVGAIGLSSLQGNTAEISFRGSTFVGEIDPGADLWGDPDSPVAKILAEREKEKDKELDKNGFSKFRKQLEKCYKSNSWKACSKLFPKKGEGLGLSLNEMLEYMVNPDFNTPGHHSFKDFVEACATKAFSKRVISKDLVLGYPDYFGDETEQCNFQKRKGRWMFIVGVAEDAC